MNTAHGTLHDPVVHERVRIETIDGWEVWGPDRRNARYNQRLMSGDTPIQLIRRSADNLQFISIITPCRSTGGRFELIMPGLSDRKCCYKCVSTALEKAKLPAPPHFSEWIIYMLLESASYLRGPAPEERA